MAKLSEAEADIIRKSFIKILANRDGFSHLFYERMFAIAPQLRGLFPDNLDAQREKFVVTLVTIVRSCGRHDELDDTIDALGKRHIEYSVEPAHFGIVGRAIIETLEEILGTAFDADTRSAWSSLYDAVAERMQAAM